MTLKIGNVELENNVILAPMAGVTDMPYRILCREQGAGLVCMEMVSAKAILYKNKNTQELLKVDERERPVSLQLFGSDPDIVADIAEKCREIILCDPRGQPSFRLLQTLPDHSLVLESLFRHNDPL